MYNQNGMGGFSAQDPAGVGQMYGQQNLAQQGLLQSMLGGAYVNPGETPAKAFQPLLMALMQRRMNKDALKSMQQRQQQINPVLNKAFFPQNQGQIPSQNSQISDNPIPQFLRDPNQYGGQ